MARVNKKSDDLGKKQFKFSGLGILGYLCSLGMFYLVYRAVEYSEVNGTVMFLEAVAVVLFWKMGEHFFGKASIVEAGMNGEKATVDLLSKRLPDSYSIFQNINITFDGKTSEIDTVVVGESGVFIVETKNTSGTIMGYADDQNWKQTKVRGQQTHEKEFYNPVKQVGTHVYRLANFLRDNGVHSRVEAAVYFANPETELFLLTHSQTPVFSAKENNGDDLIEYIMNGSSTLNAGTVEKIRRLLNDA